MNNIWDEVIKKYPDIKTVLDNLYKQQLDLLEAMEKLDEEYPVEGYEWDFDPNRVGLDANPWHLVSKQRLEDCIKRTDESLQRQLKCVNSEHEFQSIGNIQWCKYCGTVKVNKIPGIIIEDRYFYPEEPHFLPKNK